MHYLDLGHPEIGINPLTIDATPGARAAVFLQALIEANPPGAIQAASDSFLRQAVAAVCAVEREPTLWHVYRMLDFGNVATTARQVVAPPRTASTGADFAMPLLAARVPGPAAPTAASPRRRSTRRATRSSG